MLTLLATAILDAKTYLEIQSRNATKLKKAELYPKPVSNCASSPSANVENLDIPIKSTTISTILSIICIVMFVAANVSSLPSFYLIINTTNSILTVQVQIFQKMT